MKISISVPSSNLEPTHGYGVACNGMIGSLERQGHEVVFNDPAAPVEIAFTQPYNWEWSNPNAYHIGYTPWESTRLPEGWAEIMREADEIWATTEWVKWVFQKNGVPVTRVYRHGVEAGLSGWMRKRRRWREGKPLRFLHIGEPAPRKGGQLVFDSFIQTFGDRKDVSLTIKAHDYNTVRGTDVINIADNGGVYIDTQAGRPNVRVITSELADFELIDLVRRHDVLLYPTWGEGFGLIPLQAMATGMPVVTTATWAPYKHLLVPELVIPSKLAVSPWPEMHPGNMYEPSGEGLSAIMAALSDPDWFNAFSIRAYANSFHVEMQFDWDKLTAEAFADVIEKFS